MKWFNKLDIEKQARIVVGMVAGALILACALLVAFTGWPGSKPAGIVRLSVELPPGQSRTEIILPGDSNVGWEEIQQMIASVRITRPDGSTRDFSPHQFDKISKETAAFQEVTFIMTNRAMITLTRDRPAGQ